MTFRSASILGGTLVVLFLATTSLVSAQTTDRALDRSAVNAQRVETRDTRQVQRQDAATDRQNIRQDRQELREDIAGDRCEAVLAAIETRLANYDQMKDFRVNRYQSIKEQVQTLIDRLSESGYNTSQVTAALQQFDGLVLTFARDANAAAEALRATQGYACGDSQGEFKAQLEIAKAAFAKAAASAQAVGEYYRSELRPALQALRDQVQSSR